MKACRRKRDWSITLGLGLHAQRAIIHARTFGAAVRKAARLVGERRHEQRYHESRDVAGGGGVTINGTRLVTDNESGGWGNAAGYVLPLLAFLLFYCSPVLATASAQLMDAERDAQWRATFPRVDDPIIAAVLADPGTMLYTDREMHPAYQHEGAPKSIFQAINMVTDPTPFNFGNGNREFPWNVPAGTDYVEGLREVRFVWQPPRAEGGRYPVVYWREIVGGSTVGGDENNCLVWMFPRGTIVGEFLYLPGTKQAYELRTRTRGERAWSVDVYRMFPTAEDLAAAIRELRPNPDVQSATLLAALDAPLQGKPRTIRDSYHPTQSAFRQLAVADELPPIDKALLDDLFRNAKLRAVGGPWKSGPAGEAYAPSSATPSIVPAKYQGGFVPVNQASCTRCHQNTLEHVDRFGAIGTREWYGRIRGSDGIFTYHPFGYVDRGGFTMPVVINQQLVNAGLLAPFDRSKHPPSVYSRTDDYIPRRAAARQPVGSYGGNNARSY